MGRSGMVWYLLIGVAATASGFALHIFYAERHPVVLVVGLALLALAGLQVRVRRRPG